MKKALVLVLLLILGISLLPARKMANAFFPVQKMKGICVHGEDIEKEGAQYVIENLKNSGYNTIFLLIKNPQGEVYFKSNDFPVKYPVLSKTINAARKYGIRVYVYFPVFMDKHYGTLHPSERMEDVSGKTNPYYISLLSENYLEYLKKFLGELLRYDINGVVFDYIRFPNGKYDFSNAFEKLAKSEGIDFEYVKNKAYETFVYPADWKTLFMLANTDSNVKKWVELREQVVENEAQILTDYVRNINPNVKIGIFSVARGCAATIKDSENIKETYEYQVANFGQAPDKSFPFIDFIAPMIYLNSLKESPEYTISVIKKFKTANEKRAVFSAINPYGIASDETNRQILYGFSFGDGIILFRYPLFKTGNIIFEKQPRPNSETKAKILENGKAIEERIFKTDSTPFYPSYENFVFTNGFFEYAKIKITIGEKFGEKTLLPVFNKKQFQMDTAPFIKDNRTFVPIRFVSENLGANVYWDAKERKVTIETANCTIQIYIGKKTLISNGKRIQMDTAPFIKDNRTFVPIRFVSENLGANVYWDAKERKVTIERLVEIN